MTAAAQKSGSSAIARNGRPAQAERRVEDDPSFKYRWIIMVGLITAAILEVLDTTIVNVALPQMAGNLGATSEEIG